MDGDGAWLVAAGSLLGGVIGALATALPKIWVSRRNIRREERADALDEWRELTTKLEEQVERQGAVIRQGQEATEALQAENQECREDYAELSTVVGFLVGQLRRHHQLLKTLGQDPGELPEMPQIRQRKRRPESDFLVRQAQQSAELARQASEVLPRPPEGKGP